MKISEILEKAGISPENQKVIEESIHSLIEEQVSLKEEELKAKYAKLSEDYVQKELAEKEDALKKELDEQFEERVKQYEDETVENFDMFLESEISKNISDEALEKVAINETLKPVVEGVKKVFADYGLELDSEGEATLKELNLKVESFEKEINEKINENLELTKTGEKAAVIIKLNEVTAECTPEQKEKVIALFEDKSFDEVEKKAQSYADMLIEEDAKNTADSNDEVEGTDMLNEDDQLDENQHKHKEGPDTVIDIAESVFDD